LKKISKEQSCCYFDQKNKPVAHVDVGEELILETYDCWCEKIKGEGEYGLPEDAKLPNTGPIYINGASTGDIIAVEILNIECDNRGILTKVKNEGKLKQYADAPYTKIVKIENGFTYFNNDLVIKNKPHIGTIGTTPQGRIPTLLPGNHCGNFDCPEICAGTTIYLPVFVEGGLLQMGDVHANMGEGEIYCGVECGAEITIKIKEIIKNRSLAYVVIESKDHWYTLGNAPTLMEATKISSKRMADFLYERLDISFDDVAMLLSAAANNRIGQDGDAFYDVTCYTQFPKYIDRKGRLEKF